MPQRSPSGLQTVLDGKFFLIYPIAVKYLVGIRFGDFGQKCHILNLARFKIGNLVSQCPNVTSPLWCKPSLVVDCVPVACDLKLREGLGWVVLLAHLPILVVFSTGYLLYFEVRRSS